MRNDATGVVISANAAKTEQIRLAGIIAEVFLESEPAGPLCSFGRVLRCSDGRRAERMDSSANSIDNVYSAAVGRYALH